MQYIHDVKQQIENTRNFDKVDVDFSVSEPDESATQATRGFRQVRIYTMKCALSITL